jgi:xylan 1,4-beta-xylosidase
VKSLVAYRAFALLLGVMFFCGAIAGPRAATWTADNGNGTFTNPLFYEEFSDPDLIRVGADYYMTGTTMHTMPGLPILHSKDLVNWEFLGYALDKLDLGPAYRLEGGKNIYGQGIWAPSFRYHNGAFYIFSNVNHETTQVFRATNPAGPWTHTQMKRSFHDLSVLFDDDGKIYVVWGYRNIHIAQLNDDLTDMVPGTERELFPPDSLMGEGSHFYKINRKYYITSAWWAGHMRMAAARANNPYGPYEVLPAISLDEDLGLAEGYRIANKAPPQKSPPFELTPPNPAPNGHMNSHQGGIVQTPSGEWWGFSMMEHNSLGRVTILSPVTWKNGWPYFGLPGNLTRSPRTWVKPNTGASDTPHAPYARNDDFSGKLQAVWQWNHVPVDSAWSLSERPGFLRLHTLAGKDFWEAKNSLTQRAIGPLSSVTTVLDASSLKPGDVAGLALLNLPYAWIGVERTDDGLAVVQFDQQTGRSDRVKIDTTLIWLRADSDFLKDKSSFSYSLDGNTFVHLGGGLIQPYQLTTFQGIRNTLFAYNTRGAVGGYADFDSFSIYEPHPHGLTRHIPYGRTVRLVSAGLATGVKATHLVKAGKPSAFRVVDMGLGRVAFRSGKRVLSVRSNERVAMVRRKPGKNESFQWMETPTGELVLMSLRTNRYLRVNKSNGSVTADSPGPQPDGQDGVRFVWEETK